MIKTAILCLEGISWDFAKPNAETIKEHINQLKTMPEEINVLFSKTEKNNLTTAKEIYDQIITTLEENYGNNIFVISSIDKSEIIYKSEKDALDILKLHDNKSKIKKFNSNTKGT